MTGALPTFVIIGASKCATTSLHHYLGTHPRIQVSRRKELRYFLDRPERHIEPLPGRRPITPGEWRRGLTWYRSWFDPALPIRGEASPGYTSPRFTGVADRMMAVIPAAKLIYCVRDPVTRAVSHYQQAISDRREVREPGAALTPASIYVQTSLYSERLAPFLRHWSSDDVLIVAQEDLAADPAAELKHVFDFVGADPSFGFGHAEEVHLNVATRKSGLCWRALQACRRRSWWPRVAERAPRAILPALDKLTTARRIDAVHRPPAVTAEISETIRAAVADDAARFRALTGRPFASWSV